MSEEIIRQFRALYQETKVIHTSTFWLGRQALKIPSDGWIYQELIYKVKPDFIIETGTHLGGGALFLATICEMMKQGQVITVEKENLTSALNHHRIIELKGSSIDEKILKQIKDKIQKQTALVILDSDHSYEFVLKEAEAYKDIVSKNSYLIVEDTHMQATANAVSEFLKNNPQFIADKECEKFLFTFNPGGFLERIL